MTNRRCCVCVFSRQTDRQIIKCQQKQQQQQGQEQRISIKIIYSGNLVPKSKYTRPCQTLLPSLLYLSMIRTNIILLWFGRLLLIHFVCIYCCFQHTARPTTPSPPPLHIVPVYSNPQTDPPQQILQILFYSAVDLFLSP